MSRHQVLLLVVMWACSTYTYDIHKHMTKEELKHTFHVESHKLVPEYELVDVHHVQRRSIAAGSGGNTIHPPASKQQSKPSESVFHHLQLKAFGRPLNLTLIRNDGLIKGGLKMWSVEGNSTAEDGVEYVEVPETKEEIGDVFQDEENQAAVLIRKENEGLIVDGSIGSDLVIKPLPIRLRVEKNQSRADDDEMFLDEDELSSEVSIDTGLPIRRTKGHQHIVFKRKNLDEDSMSDYAFMEPDHLAKRYRNKRSTTVGNQTLHSRTKRGAPYIIYPEILVIVDYDGYRLHGGDNVQIKRYFISFWNGVDLRYKLLKGPRVRISIAGIIISRGRDATPYLERNRVGRDAIDSAAALTDMGKYLFRERRLPVYDIAVAITKLDMCRRQYPADMCNRGTAGFAYVGGACVVNKRLEKVNSVAIIEDTGGFSGIIVAAHEVGHLLGAVHDGSPPPSYLGGPGAEKCQWTDGFIMSDLRHTERGFRWSPCSVSSFHHFLNGDTATCLFNAPHEDDDLPRVLPGKLLTLDAQCRRDRGTSACFKDDRVCAQLFCFDSGSGYCVAYRPAAEGSPCGDGQYCLNGRCVAENENIIPDYSQNTPSYIRRNGVANVGRPLFSDEEDEGLDSNPDYGYSKNPYNIQYPSQPPPVVVYSAKDPTPYPFDPNSYFSPTTTTTTTPSTTPPSSTTSYYPPYSSTISSTPFYPFYASRTTQTHAPFHSIFATTPKQASYTYFGHTPSSTQYPSTSSTSSTTRNRYIGDYYEKQKQTTRNPYNFADFDQYFKSTKSPYSDYVEDINNNYLKRSYSLGSYYESTNARNRTASFNLQTAAG